MRRHSAVVRSANSSTGLGWKDDTTSQSILVKYAYNGDANLDGAVDTVDFNALAANFGQSGRNWSEADCARLAGGNVLRVMAEAEAAARVLASQRPPSVARIEDLDGPGAASPGHVS